MNPAIASILFCPRCKSGPLAINAFTPAASLEEGVLSCNHCSSWFPVIEGVPFLLTELSPFKGIVKDFLSRWSRAFDFPDMHEGRPLGAVKETQVLHYAQDSACYDSLVPDSVFWQASDWNTIGRWIEIIPQHARVLDIGCGTGRCSIPLAGKARKVIGVDLSFEMIKCAKRKSQWLKEEIRPEFIVADAESLPFCPGSFDAVIGFGILHHVEHPKDVLSEASRVVTEKGLFFALENNDSKFRWIFDLLMSVHKLWNEQGGAVPLLKKNDILKWANEAGLDVSVSTSTFLPPHLFNIMNVKLAKTTLYYSDKLMNRVPFLGEQGGQLIIKGVKAK